MDCGASVIDAHSPPRVHQHPATGIPGEAVETEAPCQTGRPHKNPRPGSSPVCGRFVGVAPDEKRKQRHHMPLPPLSCRLLPPPTLPPLPVLASACLLPLAPLSLPLCCLSAPVRETTHHRAGVPVRGGHRWPGGREQHDPAARLKQPVDCQLCLGSLPGGTALITWRDPAQEQRPGPMLCGNARARGAPRARGDLPTGRQRGRPASTGCAGDRPARGRELRSASPTDEPASEQQR